MDLTCIPEASESSRPVDSRTVIIMAALMGTLLLEALDQTVVGTAMPRIIGTLHGFDRYTWTVTAYLLGSTIMLPIAGTLSDLFGRKPFLLGGGAVFLVGSFFCGAAQTIDQLIAFRALQGLGAGIGISLVFASVSDIFPPEDRARWQGILGSVYGLSSVIGPTLGGLLAEHGPLVPMLVTGGTRWRWVFFVNLPLGIVALSTLLIAYPSGWSADRRSDGQTMASRIDLAGSVLIAAATLSLLIGLTWVGEGSRSWRAPHVQLMLGLAVFLAALLILVERRARHPVLSLDLFRGRVFAANAALTFFLWMTLFGMAFYVPLFLQGVLRVSPTIAGLVLTPFSLSIVLGNVLAGFAIARLRRHEAAAVVGVGCMTGGLALLCQMAPGIAPVSVALYAVVAGFGMGILFTATAVIVQAVLPATRLGAGFGVVRYLGQIGGVLGIALVGTVVNVSLSAELQHRLPASLTARLASDGVSLAGSPQVLVSSSFHRTALRSVTRAAAARVPPGSHHATRLPTAVAREVALLDRASAALRLSLALAIRHGLITALLFCVGAVLATLAMKRSGPRSSFA